MIIGVDFDNTIANYTGVFHSVAVALGWLPTNIGTSKSDVKSYFIEQGIEPQWTELQGIVYGKEIHQAKPYENCLEVLKTFKAQGHLLKLISHKTRYPIIGDKVDFHSAATEWLRNNAFIDHPDSPFERSNIFFNETKAEKIACIAAQQCDVFIDDLESILLAPNFPPETRKVLFNVDISSEDKCLEHHPHWENIQLCI
ncbi:hypothetical protein [Pseudoalteromonas sp. T1lg23B]|uniref:hypothetical protein n=1 Tax=Pseudoalteromonas sp. T1lg23B TaxID=2077097 RepID=UPI000CF62D97|nr:hypothetical protein [Pseudoalteromonas sp. T1lg23B]